jgi:EAL domain-containing protein (putative c-di-GMP-specific phosphodiesterase class I)
MQLIGPIGEWVLRTACAQVKTWQAAGFEELRVTVNTHTEQIHKPGLLELVPEVLAEADLEPRFLELEVSEQIASTVNDSALRTLEQLIQLGIHLTIDDFGKGEGASGEMERIPTASVKLDPAFLTSNLGDPEAAGRVAAAIDQAHRLDRRIIAKRVETDEQLACAVEHGADQAQGFLFSQAIPAGRVPDFLRLRADQSHHLL